MTISIIVPCFNEEESLRCFMRKWKNKFQLNDHFEYIFINDSSKMNLSYLRELNQKNNSVRYLLFEKFWKKHTAHAGLKHATGDLVTVMDADLQDPPGTFTHNEVHAEANPDLDCVGTRRTTREENL